MALGDSRFGGVAVDYGRLLKLHGVSITATRTEQDKIGTRDIFGAPVLDNSATPQPYVPATFTATVLLSDQYLDEQSVIAGGKPKEIVNLIALPGTFLENDEVAAYGHTYCVREISQPNLGGTTALEMCRAFREVAV